MSSNEPKKRLKAAESRRALLDAGLELLESRGVAPGLDRVTLKEAIEVSGVPRSTAYRLYEGGKGQLEEYRADLLADLGKSLDNGPTMAALERVLGEVAPLTESQDPVKMAAALREVLRVTINTNVEAVVNSLEWRVYMSSLVSLGTGESADAGMTDAFRVVALDFGERFVEIFALVSRTFGLRPRDPLTLHDFGVLVSATLEGTALRQHLDPGLANMKRATGPDGQLQSWNAAGIAVESLVVTWFERDPAASASADLGPWTGWN
jgi:AcrR family transcriptional regulator